MENVEYVVTHYSIRAIDPEIWIDLPFVTRIVRDGEHWYMFGFERTCLRPFSDIQMRVGARNLGVLQNPHPMTRGQIPWLTPDGEIYLARARNPKADENKVFLGSVPDWVRETEPLERSLPDEYKDAGKKGED